MSMLVRPELSSRGCRPEDGVRDMIVISDIDEHGINKNLWTRYTADLIYSPIFKVIMEDDSEGH